MSDIDYGALIMRADSWSARGDMPLAAIETMHQMAAAVRALRADLTEARRLLADLNKVVIDLMLAAAPVPPQPAVVPEAVESLIPKGWVFYSADASIQSSNPRRPMAAMIKRDVDGVQWWLQLTEEEKEVTPLHSSGAGMTLSQAIQNAVDAILSAADDEVKNG